MAARTIGQNYEQSSEGGRERHLDIPYARMEDTTPSTIHPPAAVLSVLPGTQICGTIITLDATDSIAVLNVAKGAVYRHNLRTVLTYNAGNENTWGAVNVGDPVYYDRSNTMPADCNLSKSPLDRLGAANPLFGYVVMEQDETAASFPKAAGAAGNTWLCAIMQA